MKYKLTKVYLTKKGDIHPKTQKVAGYDKMSVQTEQTGADWIGMFDPPQEVRVWQVGNEVEFEIVEEGNFKNFKPVTEVQRLAKKVAEIEKSWEMKFAELKADLVLEVTGKFQTKKDFDKMTSTPHPLETKVDDTGAVNPDDIPF